jgi:hypothetical protein
VGRARSPASPSSGEFLAGLHADIVDSTVTGKYHVFVKLLYTDIPGPDYYLPDVR